MTERSYWEKAFQLRFRGCPRCGGYAHCKSNKGRKRSFHRVMVELIRYVHERKP